MARSTKLALYSWVTLVVVLLESNSLLAEAPAFFVFGDSLVDNGNNNYLATTARADLPPYGIDFPTHQPTGRFSNGFNIPDIISQEIGATESPLPYLSPEIGDKKKLLIGANFASAGVGILNDTGFQFLNIINMQQQLGYFLEYQHRVSAIIGHEKTHELVNKALVLVTVGGNDFVNNYYLVPNSARSRQFSLPNYVKFLMGEYRKILMKLYELGAFRVIVTDTGSLGCVPAELAMRGEMNGSCAEELQQASNLYNPKLLDMVQGLNQELGKNVFIVASPIMEFLRNPGAYGFKSSKVACCGQGPYNGIGLCTEVSHLCSNRDLYVFWDPFHPSEKACRLIVEQIIRGPNMYPMNLSTIMDLDWRT